MPQALLLVGKRVLEGHQGLGAFPPQRETVVSSCPTLPPAPARVPTPPPPAPAPAPFHPRNPPRAVDRALACLLWLTDELLLIPMLVHTGASTSLFPRSRLTTGNLSALRHHLVVAGRTRIDCYGSRMITLQFSGKRFIWDFEVAKVKKPILRADFLTAHFLMVDLQ